MRKLLSKSLFARFFFHQLLLVGAARGATMAGSGLGQVIAIGFVTLAAEKRPIKIIRGRAGLIWP